MTKTLSYFAMFMIGGICGQSYNKHPNEATPPPIEVKVVYQDDCYMDDDYTLEIVSAKETEALLKGIIK